MAPTPDQFTRSLADPTRLRILVLLAGNAELCVCELKDALELPQPKISRHLAILRETGVLLDRRAGQWIHYRLHPDLPAWALDAIAAVVRGCAGKQPFDADRIRLNDSENRPVGSCG